jgi:hypothetical protein
MSSQPKYLHSYEFVIMLPQFTTHIAMKLVWHSHWMKIQIELWTPKDQLSLEPISLPLKKKPCTCQEIIIMEGGYEDMEANATM